MQNTLTQKSWLDETFKSAIQDGRVRAVIERLETERRRPRSGSPKDNDQSRDPYDYADRGFSIHPDQWGLDLSLVPRNARYTGGRICDFSRDVDTLFRRGHAR
jgi:hypothetical protein